MSKKAQWDPLNFIGSLTDIINTCFNTCLPGQPAGGFIFNMFSTATVAGMSALMLIASFVISPAAFLSALLVMAVILLLMFKLK